MLMLWLHRCGGSVSPTTSIPQSTRLPLQNPGQRIEIDVASSENNADPLSSDVDLSFPNRGEGNPCGWLNNNFHGFPNRAHRGNNRVLAHSHNVVHVTLDDREVWFADICSQSVGNSELLFRMDHSSRAKRLRCVICIFRFSRNHFDI